MKKTYNKLDSDLLLVEAEGGFMESSVLIETPVTVEAYKDGFSSLSGASEFDGYKSFDVTFD